jgi:hypothetical protein
MAVEQQLAVPIGWYLNIESGPLVDARIRYTSCRYRRTAPPRAKYQDDKRE